MTRALVSTRTALALGALVLFVLGASSCGGSSRDAGVSSRATSIASTHPYGGPPGDEDADGGHQAGYYDSDDGPIRDYGHAASVTDRRAIAALVERYYAAAAAEDGAAACSLMYYLLAESIPEDYGRPPGPLYLRGARTCPAVLSLAFKRFHAQLAVAPTVYAVRVKGELARALLGWRTLPAGFMEVRREGRVWRVDSALAASLP